jgi:magnesium-transporting ATPase (P-type)
MSILLISVPFYILTSWMLGKDLRANPLKRELGLRKWLVYLTLFLAAITIIVTLIVLVNNFLGGELTVRFLLKTLIVLAVAVSIVSYFIWDLRRKDQEKSKLPRNLAWVVSLVVLASIILGFFVVGTPGQQRDRKFDETRISDLNMLQSQIISYLRVNDSLPQSLSVMEGELMYSIPADPETGEPYEYRVLGEMTFELCAVFKTDGKNQSVFSFPSDPYRYMGNYWEQHGVGRACFEREVKEGEIKF